jgi:hypothetical protein
MSKGVICDWSEVLGIGGSNNLEKRLSAFIGCAKGSRKKGHSAGRRYHFLNLNGTFPISNLWFQWIVTPNKERAYQAARKNFQNF